MRRFVGLISGTSGDGIDAAIVLTDGHAARCEAYRCYPFEATLATALQRDLSRARDLQRTEIDRLDRALGDAFADAAIAVIADAGLDPAQITAIGSHGQTLIHEADAEPPRTLQVGDPQLIATRTGLTTVGDFRSADLAAGGQGAPLAPAFHASVLGEEVARCVLNLGGIANLTIIQPGDPVRGFDLGPANTLMDAWYRQHQDGPFDEGGRWASSGSVDAGLLARLLDEPFFAAPPPKSTGRDTFTLAWLSAHGVDALPPADVQATLVQLTTDLVDEHMRQHAPGTTELLICGGGVHNQHLMARIGRISGLTVRSTADIGLDPDAVEACTFGWLAARALAGLPGNLPEVTGANDAVVLGQVFEPTADLD
jgi:anhydro-N-acetylmuramic acid kinase